MKREKPEELTPLDIQNAFDACMLRKSNLDYLACIARALNKRLGISPERPKAKKATTDSSPSDC